MHKTVNILQCASVIIFQGFENCFIHTFLNIQFLLSLDFIIQFDYKQLDFVVRLNFLKRLCEIKAEPICGSKQL